MTKPIRLRPEVAYEPWENGARKLLVNEMQKQRVTYKVLSRRLALFGIEEMPDQINRKVNRKRFSAAFIFACLAALEVQSVEVPDQLESLRGP